MPRTNEQFQEMREETRQKIIGAGLTLFAKFGFAGVTMDLLATQAGISKGLIYRHFTSKDDVLEAIFHERMNQLDHLVGQAHAGPTLKKRFDALVMLTIEDAIRDLRFYRLYFSLWLQPDVTPVARVILRKFARKLKELDSSIQELFEELGLPDPEKELGYCRASVHGLILSYAENGDTHELRTQALTFVERYWHLVKKRKPHDV